MSEEEEISLMAYRMWEREGRPEGRALEHWLLAEEICEQTDDGRGESAQATPSAPAAGTRRSRKSS